jgi:hypothetical protein
MFDALDGEVQGHRHQTVVGIALQSHLRLVLSMDEFLLDLPGRDAANQC